METFNKSLFFISRVNARDTDGGIYWRCQLLSTLILFSGFIAVVVKLGTDISNLNPSAAWMGSLIETDENICVNVTCGGYYCEFAQPNLQQCKSGPYHLEKGESVELCSTPEKCDWQVKVVTDAGYENRSFGLYIYENTTGDVKNFPLIENLKHQYVDLIKYVNLQFGNTIVNWDLQTRALTSKMDSCSSNIADSRCGAYTLFFSKQVFIMSTSEKYLNDLLDKLITAFLTGFAIWFIVIRFLRLYENAREYERRVRGDKEK